MNISINVQGVILYDIKGGTNRSMRFTGHLVSIGVRTICTVLKKMFSHCCNNLYSFTICGQSYTIQGAHKQVLTGPGYSNRSDCSPSALGEPRESYLVGVFAFDSPLGLI